ncbi:WecB/TagA/CpsF family glycosyltransferase [Cloacibacillus evryensis]|uniref:WecB/TagA/CpsF family glycosyltransferase n=1 Tax=Cloacibacillus evryensis TaxID=508460 RepID=UPI00210E2BFE|nr:WecB/TagA/CpsF family glycosyltransferase [Cloacibacillus evryensis]MCQ4764464.1 WecB/TagA/CpsF family glycosyltransferase [Cloacibacillus evryensis]
MFNSSYGTTVIMVAMVALICISIQKFFKKYLESDQYYYLKDITLVGAWALCGIWMPDGPLRITVAAGVASACIGFCQRATKGKNLRFLYFLIGLVFSLFGPRIAFIEFTNGEYYYLSYFASVAISTLWVGIFPIFFQEIDEIPGLCGLLLTVSWTMISVVILSSSQSLHDASQICMIGLVLLLVFWSRHIYAYRRLTEPLTGLWGTLFAGLSILGVSKGITFYTLALLPLGFFALPITETSMGVISAAFSPRTTGNLILYRKLITRGHTHPVAIYLVVTVCAVLGCLVSAIQIGMPDFLYLLAAVGGVFGVIWMVYTFKYKRAKMNGECRKPVLWGVTVDNISLNYALTKVQHWIKTERTPHIIVTPDALAALRSRTDENYRRIVRGAGLVLPDGAGLIGALKLIGTPIQERIPGVEFTEHLCRRAAYEGWRVWMLGGAPGVAEAAADRLEEKFPGLTVVGTCDGFFKTEETDDICAAIRGAETDILFVGLGVPKQEYWLEEYLGRTGAVIGMGIGGSMDVISGRLTRAPKMWQKVGMEWLYRVIQEPWRWRRLTKLPLFVWYLALTYLHIDSYKNDDIKVDK